MFLSINPVTGQLLKRFDALTGDELNEKIKKSGNAFNDQWSKLPVEERIKAVSQLSQKLTEGKMVYAAMITTEMGKSYKQAIAEIQKCALLCDYYAENSAKYLTGRQESSKIFNAEVSYEPLGTVLGVMPWNFPFWQTFRFAIPALIAGNTVLLKPAPNTPQCGLEIEKLFQNFFPEGVFQTLLIEVNQLEQVVSHPAVQGITLTGSETAGASLASLAGKHLKKCMMELGGSDPFIVLEDADLAKAAKYAVRSRTNNSGQTCIAAKRFIAVKKVADEFIRLLIEETSKLNIGDPFDEKTDLSCLARPDLVEKLTGQVQLSVSLGAKILLEGGRVDQTCYFKPVILSDVKKGMPAYDEELFGPVFSVFTVENIEEAVTIANDTRYGLGSAVWSSDIEKAKSVAGQITSGTVAINGMVVSDPILPFGGVKKSGFGRELGLEGLLEFVNVKSTVCYTL